MKTITVIDTFGFLFRSFHALPPLYASNSFPTGMLTGFMNFVLNIGKDFETDYIVFALDSKGGNFRHDIYPQYKANRKPPPEELTKQLPVAISWIEAMGFTTIAVDGFEADDVIATIANATKDLDINTIIVSHDKDLYQLIDDKHNISLFDHIKKTKIDKQYCIDKFEVSPEQFADYQALIGDSSDNIPGAVGIGAKTAVPLIQKFGSLENIYDNLHELQKPRHKTLLENSKTDVFMSKLLVTLDKNCFKFRLDDTMKLPSVNPVLKIQEILEQFDMKAVLKKLQNSGLNYKTTEPAPKPKVEFKYILLNEEQKLFEIIDNIPSDSIVAFDTETTDIDSKTAKIVGFSFCFDSDVAYYVPIGHSYLGVVEQIDKSTAKTAIDKLNRHRLVFQNYKYDFVIIKNNFDITLNLFADTMVMAWLCDSSGAVGLDKIARRYLAHEMIAYKDIVKKGSDFSSIDIDKACEYAAEDALMTYKLYHIFADKWTQKPYEKFRTIADDIEFRFISVLIDMEQNGIRIDKNILQNLNKEFKATLQGLQTDIHEIAGEPFNIKSPMQMSNILFDKLKLKPTKKTKSGFSTDESVLVGLADDHDIVPKLLRYRQIQKLNSTYVEPFIKLTLKDEAQKIYTSFVHTGTATGRLSSKNPNLQNIPTRTKEGQSIKRAFVAKQGSVLVGLDYSQIELRLLAHFSKDPTLLEAFNNGEDIHLQTAIKIFGTDEAPANRHIAKTINFGLIYGMGSSKLAQTLGITTKEAKLYTQKYFESFDTVKDYLDTIKQFAIAHEYVETIVGRRRYFPLKDARPFEEANYLREAVNTVFQGTAADIIKLAMIQIRQKFKDNDDTQMLLQIHDELIFEIDEGVAQTRAAQIREIMEHIYPIAVPLVCSVSMGKNWSELK